MGRGRLAGFRVLVTGGSVTPPTTPPSHLSPRERSHAKGVRVRVRSKVGSLTPSQGLAARRKHSHPMSLRTSDLSPRDEVQRVFSRKVSTPRDHGQRRHRLAAGYRR
jgi:hypothetical protein